MDDLLKAIPTATPADLALVPFNGLAAIGHAVRAGWHITVSGRRWLFRHATGGHITATPDGLRFLGRGDFKI